MNVFWQETYGSTPMRSDPGHVVYVSVGSRQVAPLSAPCISIFGTLHSNPGTPGVDMSSWQRFGENKMGKIALSALGLALVACLVYSAATEV